MAAANSDNKIESSISKVNDEIAVGDDLNFQRSWWRFENAAWIVLVILTVLDALGLFGKGYLANAEIQSEDAAMNVKYERIERFGTPSILTIQFKQAAVQDRKLQIWVSDNLVSSLGNQRIIPQPSASVIDKGGILYTFPATTTPLTVQFELTPAKIGSSSLTIRLPQKDEIKPRIFVMP